LIHVACTIFLVFPEPTANLTLSLHDALPILDLAGRPARVVVEVDARRRVADLSELDVRLHHDLPARGDALRDPEGPGLAELRPRSEEHTSELQSRENLVCRLLLETTQLPKAC